MDTSEEQEKQAISEFADALGQAVPAFKKNWEEAQQKETVTSDDLDRIFIRARMPAGNWVSTDVKSCSDEQFNTWAKSRMQIRGEDAPWSPEERAKFCNMLYQAGALHMLKKDVEFKDE